MDPTAIANDGPSGNPNPGEGTWSALGRGDLLLRAIVECSLDGILVTDPDGRFVEVNPAFCELIGLSRDQLLGRRYADFAPADSDVARLRSRFLGCGRDRGTVAIVRPDGELRYVEYAVRAQVIDDLNVSVMRDITARLEASERHGETAQLLEALVATAPVGIALLDGDGHLEIWNQAARRITGFRREEVEAGTAILTDDDRRGLAEVVGTGLSGENLAVRRQTRDGQWIDLMVSHAPLPAPEGQTGRHIVTFADVTEYRRLERQLLEAQKMEAIGLLAGGVAHDFNNMLSAIQGFAGVVESDLPEGDPLREDVEEILAASSRAAELTRQLLQVSRRQPMEMRALDLCDLLSGLERMLARVLGEDVLLTIRRPTGAAVIRADRTHIEQIVLNLVVNARDAMPGGGQLGIEVDRVRVEAAIADLAAGDYVRLAVTDTGTGMDEVTLRRVFEPFYTTKAKGRGTGLGLPTVYGIVHQLGGHIAIDSSPGRGTRVTVHLPPAAGEPVVGTRAPGRDDDLSGTGTVLVVEDEPAVRRMIGHVLERHGYQVHLAANAGEALLLAEQEAVDLVLTDVVMPRFSGFELVARLRETRPALPVLYVSGYSDGRPQPAAAAGEVLAKPFQPAELLRRVRRLLGPQPSATGASTGTGSRR
jgi:two-component system, cell cycle sensor histidine kinase and response regulator CckA